MFKFLKFLKGLKVKTTISTGLKVHGTASNEASGCLLSEEVSETSETGCSIAVVDDRKVLKVLSRENSNSSSA